MKSLSIYNLYRPHFQSRLLLYGTILVFCALVALRGPSLELVVLVNLCLLAFLLWSNEVAWISIAFIADLIFAWHWGDQPIVPKAVQWISHFVILIALLKIILSLFAGTKKFPMIAYPLVALSVVGISRALTLGEETICMVWGWFVVFKYSIIFLYIYFARGVPDRSLDRFFWVCFGIVFFELGVQVLQYLTGVTPGDSLAGTFGLLGTHQLILFDTIVLCWAAARFMVRDDLWILVVVTAASLLSAVLSEGKVFFVILLIICSLTIFMKRQGMVFKKVISLGFGITAVWGFVALYTGYYSHINFLDYIYYQDARTTYLENIRYLPSTGQFDVGRLASLRISFDRVSDSYDTLLLGFGSGSATESQTLGVVGSVIKSEGSFLSWRGSMPHILLEYGLFGCAALLLLFLLLFQVGWKMLRGRRSDREIGFTIIMYTALLPLLLFYTYAIEAAVPNIIFWGLVGYALRRTSRNGDGSDQKVSQV